MSISFEVSTDKTFEKFDPKSSNVIATYKDYSPEEVFQIVANAKTASRAWKNLGFRGRKKVLTNWAKYLTQNVEELAKLLAQETGKPLSDAMLEVSLAISHLTWANKHAPEILSAQRRSPGLLMFNMKSYVQREPFGCIGVIGPWNYPVFTPMGSIVYALAAGNTVVFKPSEFTPGCGKWLADTFAKISPFEFIFTTVTGKPQTGIALTQSSVDKISFTGSTRTAKKVAAACAEKMIPVILECGGKDPVLVAEDADLKLAAEYTLWSAMANAGQSCIGAERVYVVNKVADKFIATISEMAKQLKVGEQYGPATMPSQLNVISEHINDAANKGAIFAVGGKDSVKAPFVEPVIMLDVPENTSAMTEETFGPTLAINRVENIAQAIELSNSGKYGLAAAVFSKRNGEKIAAQLICGMVSVNSVFSFAAIASVPFGGVKDSGSGRIHGPEGLLEFTFARTIVKTKFQIPLKFTTFKRTKFSDNFLIKLIKSARGRSLG